mmetsp:Transcript_30267/g.64243  ORF Transcript_30267/g.64243 Transcript_30267/m.64243 type:complete len:116 (+) Transcript_30267:455-802(+)
MYAYFMFFRYGPSTWSPLVGFCDVAAFNGSTLTAKEMSEANSNFEGAIALHSERRTSAARGRQKFYDLEMRSLSLALHKMSNLKEPDRWFLIDRKILPVVSLCHVPNALPLVKRR